MPQKPSRVICLSAEAADWLWRLGEWNSIVGVTAFFELPPGAEPKPKLGGFSAARIEEVVALNPDLVVTFSDVQADMTAELMRRGIAVLGTNQRSLAEVESTLALLGSIVQRENEAKRLLKEFRERSAPVADVTNRPRIYFEEWNDPLISGICWVSELIERAGGTDIFGALQTKRKASERVVGSEEVCKRSPDLILASWCGKPVQVQDIASRPGWRDLSAVQNRQIYEINSADILQPGFRLLFGYEQIKERVRKFHLMK